MLGKVRNRIGCFFLLLFIGYTAGITLFTHSHVIDGVTIIHSHPYNKNINHSHTAVELMLIHLLSHFDSTTPDILPVVFTFTILFSVFISYKIVNSVYTPPNYGLTHLRGPPTIDFA